MKEVCVITGGGSGMGLKTAHIMGKTHYVIISDRTVSKLEKAISEFLFQHTGIEHKIQHKTRNGDNQYK